MLRLVEAEVDEAEPVERREALAHRRLPLSMDPKSSEVTEPEVLRVRGWNQVMGDLLSLT
jgi:hypothetical protein